jgi:hypothetical protein
MSTLATLSDQEQQFLDTFQQAVERDQFDRLILSQYKGELQDLEKMTLRVITLNEQRVLSCRTLFSVLDYLAFRTNSLLIPLIIEQQFQ